MFSIELNKADYGRIMTALRRLPRAAENANNDMQKACAVQYKQDIAFNIMTQRFNFRPHSKLYRLWKQANYPEYPAFWRLNGIVLRSLSVFQYQGGWMGGIPTSAIDTDGRPVAYRASKVEEGWIARGGKPRPARRLFFRTKEEFRKDPTKWKKQGAIAQTRIKSAWR